MERTVYSTEKRGSGDPERLGESDGDFTEDESNPFLHQRLENYTSKAYQAAKNRWLAISAVAWLLSLLLTWKVTSILSKPRHDIALGLETELAPLKSQIEIQTISYTGDLDWNENGTLVRTSKPGETRYVGEPSPEVDAAWAHLIFGDAVDLRGAEATTVEGTTIQKPDGWWVLGIDVFHHLHCLNMIRKTLHLDYYGMNEKSSESYQAHIEHCVDSIRQALMCTSDITAYPVEWNGRYHRPRPNFITAKHTCRNFEKIRDWAAERATEQHPDWV